jgi:hypothetical protein
MGEHVRTKPNFEVDHASKKTGGNQIRGARVSNGPQGIQPERIQLGATFLRVQPREEEGQVEPLEKWPVNRYFS